MILVTSTKLTYPNYVYILLCEGGRIYVGFTTRLHLRLRQHYCGGGAFFTRTYKPVKLLEVFRVTDDSEEYRIWCIHAHRMGLSRCGGYGRGQAECKGFDWEFPPVFTKVSYKPTLDLVKIERSLTQDEISRIDASARSAT